MPDVNDVSCWNTYEDAEFMGYVAKKTRYMYLMKI